MVRAMMEATGQGKTIEPSAGEDELDSRSEGRSVVSPRDGGLTRISCLKVA